MSNPTAIVGAGLAGLVAAQELLARGHDVVVFEAGPVAGGRLATATVGHATFDHGAQFFTTRSDRFTAFVADLVAGGVVYEWCQGFNEADGYPRYAAHGGMAALADHLAAGVDVRLGVSVQSVRPQTGRPGAIVETSGGPLEVAAAILTPPVPVSLGLLAGVTPNAALADVAYHRVLAVLVTLAGPSALPAPGARQLTDGPFSFVSDNRQKGISSHTAVTLHAAHGLSAQRWGATDDEIIAELVAEARPWLGNEPVIDTRLERWLHSGPVQPWPEPCHAVTDNIVLAGDAFAGPKVEGAFLSGAAAAEAVAAQLAPLR